MVAGIWAARKTKGGRWMDREGSGKIPRWKERPSGVAALRMEWMGQEA